MLPFLSCCIGCRGWKGKPSWHFCPLNKKQSVFLNELLVFMEHLASLVPGFILAKIDTLNQYTINEIVYSKNGKNWKMKEMDFRSQRLYKHANHSHISFHFFFVLTWPQIIVARFPYKCVFISWNCFFIFKKSYWNECMQFCLLTFTYIHFLARLCGMYVVLKKPFSSIGGVARFWAFTGRENFQCG